MSKAYLQAWMTFRPHEFFDALFNSLVDLWNFQISLSTPIQFPQYVVKRSFDWVLSEEDRKQSEFIKTLLLELMAILLFSLDEWLCLCGISSALYSPLSVFKAAFCVDNVQFARKRNNYYSLIAQRLSWFCRFNWRFSRENVRKAVLAWWFCHLPWRRVLVRLVPAKCRPPAWSVLIIRPSAP